MNVGVVFHNENNRLRSGWRFGIFLLVLILSGFLFGGLLTAIVGAETLKQSGGVPLYLFLTAIVSLIPALLAGWLCGKFLEGLPFRALGAAFSKGWLKHLAVGSAIGLLSMGLAVAIAFALGGLSFLPDPDFDAAAIAESLFASLAVFAAAAAFEEALFRGYILQTFARAGLAWLAIVGTALLFTTVHLNNPNANWISTTNTALAGVWFGLAYLKTRDLWFPFGIHLMWNWVQGSIFGIEVSGLKNIASATLLKEVDRGPAWLTGENYGIEGSIACTIVIITAIAAIYFLPLQPDDEMLAMSSEAKASTFEN
ncbi:MAG TPA: type II CAAX endopeptidase family protein [Pyrinomonadaceae bacterium]|nr:type II CAAX endopeptidase family protein [Pyrinomonadaceae bacterium]